MAAVVETTAATPAADCAAMSFAQERLWFLDLYEPGTTLYTIPVAWRIEGVLDRAALARSLDDIVRRHDVLRTTFALVDGRPMQVIAPSLHVPLPLVDVSGAGDPVAAAQSLVDAEATRPFDLKRGPLIRAGLIRLDDRTHVLQLTLHHIVSDGWSTGVLLRELGALYGAYAAHGPPPLALLALQYADYAEWQRDWLQGDALDAELDHWKRVLRDAPATLALPTDRPHPATPSQHGDAVEIALDAGIADTLRALVRRAHATPFMALAAAFVVLLHRYTAEDDLCIGYPVANRNRAELEPLLGLFVNTLVLRTRIAPSQSFEALLGDVREAVLDADAHQDLPFEKLVEALQPERGAGRTPLFQVLMAYDAGTARLDLAGLATRPLACRNDVAKFELALGIAERDGGWVATFRYDTALFDRTTIERMAAHYRNLVAAATAQPQTAVADLPLLGEAERRRLLHDWNDTARDYPRDATLDALFERQAARTPDAVALAYESQTITYAALDAQANRLAHRLRAAGVGTGSLVVICAGRSPALVAGLLGILKAGAAYVPFDPAWPAGRQRKLLRTLGASAIVTTQDQLVHIRDIVDNEPVCLLDDAAASDGERSDRPDVPHDATRRAYVIFTSGSTGEPKGVVLTHRPVVNVIDWVNRSVGVGAADRLLFVTSPCFDLSVYDVFGTLAAGGTVDIAPQRVLNEPSGFADYVRDRPITFWDSAPAAFTYLTQLMQVASGDRIARTLRVVFLSGDWIALDTPARIAALFPRARLVALGGATEAAIWSNAYFVDTVAPHWRSIPYGRPIQNARYYVLDARLAPVPVGVAGDLYIGGECLASGYYGDAAQTAASFLPDPFHDGTMYRTGDTARFLADGNIEFLGRRDQQVKVRGFRVELGEIEHALARCPGVRTAVVAARRGDAPDVRLVAYVVPEAARPDAADLRAQLAAGLPEYMLPSAVVFIDALPLTANGKLDRQRLPAPDTTGNAGYVAPRTPAETALAAIWADVLRIDRVGVHDNFFALGGYSLAIVQVAALLRSRYGCDVAVRDVFGTRDLAELAARVTLPSSSPPSPALPAASDGAAEPRRYLASRRVADEILWNDTHHDSTQAWFQYRFTVHVRTPFTPDAIRRALRAVVERHPVLTARFALDGGDVWMCEGAFDDLEFQVVALDDDGADPLQAARRHLLDTPRRPFDRLAGPLCRFTLIPLGAAGHVLSTQIDHALFDLQSQDIFLADFTAALRTLRQGPEPHIGTGPAPAFAAYCRWHRGVLDATAWQRLVDYWTKQFQQPVAPYLALFGEPRHDPAQPRWRHHAWVLGARRSAAVGAACRALGVTPLVLFLAGVRRWALHERQVGEFEIETDVLGRVDPAFNRTVGFFSTNLVFRFATAPDTALRELIADTAHTFADGLAHQELPFFSLKRIANPALAPDNFHWPIKFSQQTSVLGDAGATADELAPVQLGLPGGGAHPLCIYLTGAPGDWRIDYYYDATVVEADAVESLARASERLLDELG